tara:strand:- start:96 stop:290 length:195 start_codon:yes stop_codon:yes gene_type:complete
MQVVYIQEVFVPGCWSILQPIIIKAWSLPARPYAFTIEHLRPLYIIVQEDVCDSSLFANALGVR